MVATGRGFGEELCKALGLESRKVRRVQLDVEAGGIAMVKVWEYVEEKEAGDMVEICREYELHGIIEQATDAG